MISCLVIICFGLLAFNSLGNKSESFQTFSSGEFLAEQEGLNLLIVGSKTSLDLESLRNDIRNQNAYLPEEFTITQYDYTDDFKTSYPHLEISKTPAYFLFDSTKLLYNTYHYDEIVEFLVSYSNDNS